MPLRRHENVLFLQKLGTYNKQMGEGNRMMQNEAVADMGVGKYKIKDGKNDGQRSAFYFKIKADVKRNRGLHPTQTVGTDGIFN